MLWRNTKECVVSENSCSKNFVNFQEKHPSEIAFLNKVAGYLILTGNIFLGNLWNFQNRFHKKHLRMMASAIVTGKCFNQNIFFKKYLIRFDIQWHVLPGIKYITEVWRPFTMFILVCTWFVRFTSLRALFIWTSGNVTSIVSITHTVIFSKQEVSRRRVARGSPEENTCSRNNGKKKQL